MPQNTATYASFRVADLLSRQFPRPFCYWVALRLADLYAARDAAGRAGVVANLRRIHRQRGAEPSEAALALEARQTFRYFSKHVVDFFRMRHQTEAGLARVLRVEHPERIAQAAALGRGVMALTAHVGNWEVGAAMLAARGYAISAVVLPQRDDRTNALFQQRRRERGVTVLPLGRAARGALEAIRRREFVAVLADQDYTRSQHTVPFFGAPARLPSGPAKLAVRTGAVILPGFVRRQPDDTFAVRIHPPIVPAADTTVDDIQLRICRVLEEEIAAAPSQWFIFRDFWAA